MKSVLICFLAIIISVKSYCQVNNLTPFSLDVNIGKSFLSYGDIWGFERKISLQYGNTFYVAIDYGFANFEGAQFTEDYYMNLKNSTLVTKYLNSISGNSEIKFFGLKSLDTKDNLITLNSYQVKVGGSFNLFTPRLQFGLFGSTGIVQLSRIGTDFSVSGVDIYNPNFAINDVTIFGTFSHRFIDFIYGFGTEFSYDILENRLKLSLIGAANLSSISWFTIGLGANVNI